MTKKRTIKQKRRKPTAVNMPWWLILLIVFAAITISLARILK